MPVASPRLRIGICGAGISGLVTASALCQIPDLEVTIFEAKSQIRSVGAGIAIWKPAWTVLEKIINNFESRLEKHGVKVAKWSGQKGPMLRKADYETQCGIDMAQVPLGPRVLPRDILLEVLHRSLEDSICHVHTDKKLSTWKKVQQEILLLFEDGSSHTVDLLIGGDGVHSRVRQGMFEDQPHLRDPVFSGEFAYRMSCSKADVERINPDHPALRGFTIWCGAGRHVTSHVVRNDVQMTAYDYVFDEHGEPINFAGPWVTEEPASEIAGRFHGWEADLVALLHLPQIASRWAIHAVHPLPTFVADQVCLIGDAAHAMTPHLGQGGNQGIQDAFILAQLLSNAKTTRQSMVRVLGIYDSIRRPASQESARKSMMNGLMYGFLEKSVQGPCLETVGKKMIASGDGLSDADTALGEWHQAWISLDALAIQ